MQYALTQVLPDIPPGGVCAGIDWASKDHVACVVDMAGRVTDRFSAVHDKAGIAAMITRLRRAGASEVAIERSDGVLVGALLAAGLTVVVITSRHVKNLRSRYSSSGGKDDRFDSYVLADTLRTDRARLRPLIPDTPATITLRAAVRARKDLVAHRVAAANQLRAHLAVAFPAAIGLFHELDSPLSLAFLARFGSQDAAAGLDEDAIVGWLSTLTARGNPAPPGCSARGCGQHRRVRPAATAPPRPPSRPRWPPPCPAWPLRSRPWRPRSPASWPPTPTRTSSPASRARARCALPGSWPRSATAGPGSPTPGRWPRWPGSRR